MLDLAVSFDTVTKRPDSPDDENTADIDLSAADVYDEMESFEPYTTGELASVLDIPMRLARKLLTVLTADGQIRKKELDSDRAIWIREPPKHECPECNREFEIKYFHPVFQAVQFCPRCGTQLE